MSSKYLNLKSYTSVCGFVLVPVHISRYRRRSLDPKDHQQTCGRREMGLVLGCQPAGCDNPDKVCQSSESQCALNLKPY